MPGTQRLEFAQVQQLDESALRQLLTSGDSRTRLYAVWALGLRAAPAKEFATQLVGEPAPGLRRALAVVLAGHGETDLLVTLARHDPDVHVRASAAAIVVRFTRAGRVPWQVVGELLEDGPEVQRMVLGELDAPAPPALVPFVLRALASDDAALARSAFDLAVQLPGADADAALRRYLERTPEVLARAAIEHWFAVAPPVVIARALAGAAHAVRALALRARPALVLAELAPLLDDDIALFEQLQHELALDLRVAPLGLVLALATKRPTAYGQVAFERLEATGELAPALRPVLAELARACDDAITSMSALLASPEDLEYFADEFDSLAEARDSLLAQRDLVARLRDLARS